MASPCLSGLQQLQQSNGAHSRKRSGGLLSRLFGSLPTEGRVESSSAALKSSTRAARGLQCPAAVPGQAAAFPATNAGTVLPTPGQSTSEHVESISFPVLNYKINMEEKYSFVRELGKGGNGLVRVVVDRETGEEFACKSIKKVLKDVSEKKKQGHLESIRREVQALTKLRGSLNVVKLEDVYEDEEHVHLVMELCGGGELWHRIGDRHYSERTVASFMRAVLRTLAQCHARNLLHRDVKPGNFMLLSGDERAPIKAIDFGLAAPFDPEELPRTDLGLEGTPWYMAPETLRGEYSPGSDVWAAGVMAFQLLSGRFPFDDQKNPFAPAITALWRSVLNDPLDFSGSSWSGISEEARDFCRLLLNRDVAARPSAREALRHPWLRGDSSERSTGKPLSRSVVSRIQRFASGSLLRRSVLHYIAAELLAHPELLATAAPPAPAATAAAADDDGSVLDAGTEAAGNGHVATQADGGSDTVCGSDADTRKARAKGASSSAAAGALAAAAAAVPDGGCLARLLSQLRLDEPGSELDEQQLGEALARMGFSLAPSEVSRLMEGLDTRGRGSVGRSCLVAGLVDWRQLQRNHSELWLQLAARAFRRLDNDGSGVLEVDELLAALRDRLPPEEVRCAVEEALREASEEAAMAGFGLGAPTTASAAAAASVAGIVGGGMDFEAFIKMLKVGSQDSISLYDDRMSVRSGGSRGASLDRCNALLAGSSHHRRPAALGTSYGAAAMADWSRHGAGGSRHGYGGADASVHSHVSDRSDSASVYDNDRSQHGVHQVWQPRQPPHRHAPAPTVAAAAPAAATAFRFDIDRADRSATAAAAASGGGKGVTAAAASVAAVNAAVAGSSSTGSGGGMVWRFDVGGPKAPPASAQVPVWRFDVGGGSPGTNWDQTGSGAGQQAAANVSAAAAAGDRSGSSGGAAAAASGSGSSLLTGRQGGYFDRRMHGSNLYRNVALKALQGGVAGAPHRCLGTVAE